MFRTALRNVLAHKARLLMTLLAVLLGVAFVSGTLVFTDSLKSAFVAQSTKNYKDTAVYVFSNAVGKQTGKEPPGLSERDLDRFRSAAGVRSVTGRVEGFAGVAD